MTASREADPTDQDARTPAVAYDGQNLNENGSFHSEGGRNETNEADPIADEDNMHSEPEGDEDGSEEMEDEDSCDGVHDGKSDCDAIDDMEDMDDDIDIGEMQDLIAGLFSTRSIAKHYLRFFEEGKSEVKCLLNSMGRLIPLSVDMLSHYQRWGNTTDYVSLAANFIDNDWKLKKWLLHFQLYDPCNSDFVDAVIVKALDDYNLTDKAYTLTSRDNDLVDETLESIQSQLKEKNRLPSERRLFHVSCVAEMFGLMAEGAFKAISDIISTVKELHWSRSECMWHLTHSKLESALEMEALGEFNSEFVTKHYSVPSAEGWEKVRVICRLVGHVYGVAKKVFQVKNSTANLFLYNLQELRASLLLEASSPDAFTCRVANKMLKKLTKYIRTNYLVLAIASVMDPRYKMQFIDEISAKFEGIDGILQPGLVLEAVRSIYAADYSEGALNGVDLPGKSELDIYLEEPVLLRGGRFSVLNWWKSEGSPKYSNVSKMARAILAVPLSVATSYDAYYYIENRPADPDVITTGAKLMNAQMCSWSWKGGKTV
ncbi:unnamed protein product [Cuscuta epithymum]|uniref:Uncharacterized protein n=1 Tax=Cuscuta epithymum TaxID=186058 RepID=A0AAV0DXS9_9ASTE|nr:unnamed protein product [Cuscuta epithymum]